MFHLHGQAEDPAKEAAAQKEREAQKTEFAARATVIGSGQLSLDSASWRL